MADDRHYVPGTSCVIKGCSGLIRSLGFCSRHYSAWRRYGHPLGGKYNEYRVKNGFAPSETKERRAWHSMRARCANENHRQFCDYGGRGITVCADWLGSFDAFLHDLGPAPTVRHSLERIDVNGGYEPTNCRWATALEQNRNTRAVQLNWPLVVYARTCSDGGVSIAELSRDLGVNYSALYQAVAGTSWSDARG